MNDLNAAFNSRYARLTAHCSPCPLCLEKPKVIEMFDGDSYTPFNISLGCFCTQSRYGALQDRAVEGLDLDDLVRRWEQLVVSVRELIADGQIDESTIKSSRFKP